MLSTEVDGADTHTHHSRPRSGEPLHFTPVLEGHVTQNLRKGTGTGTAKSLETTQRHEQKRNGKLFLNEMRNESDCREYGNLFRRDAQQGALLRRWLFWF